LKENATQTFTKAERRELKKACKKGIPDEFRARLWLRATGAAAFMDFYGNIGYYEKLKRSALDYPNPSFQQIELDLKRTFQED